LFAFLPFRKKIQGKHSFCVALYQRNHTKLIFLRTTLLIAPSPNANIAPPAAQSTTLIAVEPGG
jgi:hypothetical protein